MKKFVLSIASVLCAAVMVFAFVGCGDTDDSEDTSEAASETVSEAVSE